MISINLSLEAPQISLAKLNSLNDFSSVRALRGKSACRD